MQRSISDLKKLVASIQFKSLLCLITFMFVLPINAILTIKAVRCNGELDAKISNQTIGVLYVAGLIKETHIL